MTSTVRLWEWARVSAEKCGIDTETAGAIDAAVDAWRRQNRLPHKPLWFEGQRLCARQYVGVVEVDGVCIEIFPKLDADTIDADAQLPCTSRLGTVMDNLLWMLHVAEYRDVIDAETAHLAESETTFTDLFAWLLGTNLLAELERGIVHRYVGTQDDLRRVRGRIDLVRQVTRNWNRFDRIACNWDEFTPNTPMNRVFRCACRFLSQRVAHAEAARLLLDCQGMLDEVDDISPVTAVRESRELRFDRSTERFRTAFGLASRLLSGIGHHLGSGDANTFVFLVDMNKLFESYVRAVLQDHFDVPVHEQTDVGTLFRIEPGGVHQLADYYWKGSDGVWIGDAKYKHLAKGVRRPLQFTALEDPNSEAGEVNPLAAQVLNAADVRQLTVYAELARKKFKSEKAPSLMLLYPFVGDDKASAPHCTAWNGSEFWLVPVKVKRQERLREAISLSPV